MHTLKFICQTAVGLLKRACRWPYAVTFARKESRRQTALDLFEAERLDRLRNPSRYLGK